MVDGSSAVETIARVVLVGPGRQPAENTRQDEKCPVEALTETVKLAQRLLYVIEISVAEQYILAHSRGHPMEAPRGKKDQQWPKCLAACLLLLHRVTIADNNNRDLQMAVSKSLVAALQLYQRMPPEDTTLSMVHAMLTAVLHRLVDRESWRAALIRYGLVDAFSTQTQTVPCASEIANVIDVEKCHSEILQTLQGNCASILRPERSSFASAFATASETPTVHELLGDPSLPGLLSEVRLWPGFFEAAGEDGVSRLARVVRESMETLCLQMVSTAVTKPIGKYIKMESTELKLC